MKNYGQLYYKKYSNAARTTDALLKGIMPLECNFDEKTPKKIIEILEKCNEHKKAPLGALEDLNYCMSCGSESYSKTHGGCWFCDGK